MNSVPPSAREESDFQWALKTDFGELFLHNNAILLSHLDVSTEPKPQRNLPFVQDAVASYIGEKDVPESTKSPSTFLSKLDFFSRGTSDSVIGDYHALSRLYAAVYSQFPKEADKYINHSYIYDLNDEVWKGGKPTDEVVYTLKRQMNALLLSIGIQDQI